MKRETGPESGLAFGCGEAGRHSRTGASGGCSRREDIIRTQRQKRSGLRPGYAEAPAADCAGFRVYGRNTAADRTGQLCAELFSAEERERQRGGGEQRSGSHDARPAEVRPCGAREECTQRAAREIGAHEDRIDAVRGRRA